MSQKEFGKLLRAFLWERRWGVGLFVLSIWICSVVFFLYQNWKIEAALYAGLLCLILSGICGSIQFVSFCKQHFQRKALLQTIPISYKNLPPPSTLAEQEMQELVSMLETCYYETQTAWQVQQKECLDYYSVWVHQIKTPIASMKLLLQQQEDTKEKQVLLAELFRIEQYTEMVLQYLRLDSPTTDFVFQGSNLDTIIRQAIRNYAVSFVTRNVRLIYQSTSVMVLTDEKWLLMILEQLLSNAVKYTPSGGSVTITVTPDFVLQIADTGIGIASEDLPRIFEKGFTGYNGRENQKSTGLGLYLCQQAAKKISISLSVTSEIGKGSVFSVHLSTSALEME